MAELADRSHFEVRCPRCDVSFPVETRTCMHCGGPTSPEGQAISARPIFGFDSGFDSALSTDSTPTDEALVQSGDDPSFDYSQAGMPPGSTPESAALDHRDIDSETPNVGRSILGSMGSLIWILMLVAFSLSGRVCGE
jgi:hypothetical protein